MNIQLVASGFREWHDHTDGVPAIGIESARIGDCVAEYHERGFEGIFGSPSFGFRQDHLDFLREMRTAKWLWFWDVVLLNVDAIYDLVTLESVGINPKRPGIDFSKFPALQTAINHWIKADRGISESKLRNYTLWHFKPRHKHFEELELPRDVLRLEFNWANPETLRGLPLLSNLTELQFHRCRNLNDLSLLPQIAPNLRSLTISSSKRVDPTSGVLDHPTLRSAYINAKVVLNRNAST